MAPGAVAQDIYIRGVPPGVKMFITDVTFKIPGDDWWPLLSGLTKSFSISRNTTDDEKKRNFPVEVLPDYRGGYIGQAYLSSKSIFDTGSGPEIYIHFKLEGVATVEGQTTEVNTTGFITVSTSDWGATRPDYCNTSYYLQNLPPRNLSNEVPALQSPKDVSFVIGVDPKAKQVGINASVDENVVKDLIGYALKGIFMAHEKAAGWVIGAI
ncbi:hypothetical protein D9758_018619 [Tetrapyrgos nigripes]|uniref:Uncharacterized protein n=1 Tax=Tetrapyrgos nigripes TaxID=182062 RepID=A0A8H5C354_9AGAR|nr:hypothetical protein D9758_018619 [Tetrapyrgos nigripes]